MTVKEYINTTPEGHYELIYGNVSEPPSPDYGHQESSGGLFVLMRVFALDNGKYKLAQSAGGNVIAKSLVLAGFEVRLKEIF